MKLHRHKLASSFLAVVTVTSIVSGSLPISAFAEVYTGELPLTNSAVLQDKGGGPVSVTAFNSYIPSAPTFTTVDSNNNFRASLLQKNFSASLKDGALNCTADDVTLNPANRSTVLTYITPYDYTGDQGGDPLCLPNGPAATVQNTVITHTGSGNSYGGLGVSQSFDVLPFLTIGEAAQNTTVESIPNDPNNVRVTISNNVKEEAYGLHAERQGDVFTFYPGDLTRWLENSYYREGNTYIINWTSNWVGQVAISLGDEMGTAVWADPSTATYNDNGGLTFDPLYVNTGYPTPNIIPLVTIFPSTSYSVVRPRNSDVISVTQPQCTRWTDGNFWRTVQHVHCRTYGISADGRTGYGDYYDSQSSGGWFQEFLGVGLLFAGLAFGGEFLSSFLSTVAEQMTAIQAIAVQEGLAISSSALTNVIGQTIAEQITFAGVASGVGNSAALASLSAFTTASVAAVSGPTTLGTVEGSNGLGVGTWTWTAAPEFQSSGDSSTTCQDATANNYGAALPCTYPPNETCQDRAANNYGGALPCTYTGATCEIGNICGATSTGTVVNGFCNATAPALPANYGASCSPANNCGDTNEGRIGCNGLCSASAPADRASCVNPPTTCSITNVCGTTNTGTLVGGVCSVTAPADPADYGSLCTPANNCGDISTGVVGCNNGCSVSAPPDRVCTAPVDGSCSIPTTHYSCGRGADTNHAETALSWSWDCAGSNGGATVSCVESKFNAQCSATHWGCTLGTLDVASQTGGTSGPWTWTCNGFNGGNDASCTQPNGGFRYCPDGVTPIPPSGVCPGTRPTSTCPDGSPIPPGGCPPIIETTTNGLCATPATYFNLCKKGTASNWNDTNPALRTWDCVGSGLAPVPAHCSQDVITLCVDRSIRLCARDQSYSFYRECGDEKDRVPCAYGCTSGYCGLPGEVAITKFEVKPALVKKGTATTVYWDVQNASSCTVTSSATGAYADTWTTRATWPNTNTSGASGIQSQQIQGHTVFTLACNPFPGDPSLTAKSSTATVDIAPIFQEL